MRRALAGCVIVAACHTTNSSSVDASLVDAPPPEVDADTAGAGDGWRQVSLSPVDATLLETRAVHPDRSARFRITHLHCPGDYPGRWNVGFTLENEYVSITATVWRVGPDCTDPEIVSRLITIKFL